MSEYKFSNKEKVTFVYGDLTGYGEVVGVATTELPIIGSYYMVNVIWTDSVAVKNHPFKVVAIPEINLVSIAMNKLLEKTADNQLVYKVFQGQSETPLLQLNHKFVMSLRGMPTPEREMFLDTWLTNLITSTDILSLVEETHLRVFMKSTIFGDVYQ